MILYDWKTGLTSKESHARLITAWGDQAPSDRMVRTWFHEYQQGNLKAEDRPRSGRPRTAVTEEMIDAVRAIIEEDPHSTYQEIQHILDISSASVNSIIHDYLDLHKVCARWVPHQLIDAPKPLR
ncbi:unnamed protein product, partial [Adineta ricciae]